jgi:hypothetical protein
MANAKVKTEMKGDRARWTTREDAKTASKKRRRANDRNESRYWPPYSQEAEEAHKRVMKFLKGEDE